MNEKTREFRHAGPHMVDKQDLPIACPTPQMMVWNAHPRVYLPIEQTGEATCPYCGAHYVLKEVE